MEEQKPKTTKPKKPKTTEVTEPQNTTPPAEQTKKVEEDKSQTTPPPAEPVKEETKPKEQSPPPVQPKPEPKTLADFTPDFAGTSQEIKWRHFVNKVIPSFKSALNDQSEKGKRNRPEFIDGLEFKTLTIAKAVHAADLLWLTAKERPAHPYWIDLSTEDKKSIVDSVKTALENPEAQEPGLAQAVIDALR